MGAVILDFGLGIGDLKKGGVEIGREDYEKEDKGIFQYDKLDVLMKENDEILAIIVASIKTAKKTKN